MIQVPEKGIGGFLYTWVNGADKAGAAVCLFGSGIGEEPILELCDGIAVRDDMDFFDWKVGELQVQNILTIDGAKRHGWMDGDDVAQCPDRLPGRQMHRGNLELARRLVERAVNRRG